MKRSKLHRNFSVIYCLSSIFTAFLCIGFIFQIVILLRGDSSELTTDTLDKQLQHTIREDSQNSKQFHRHREYFDQRAFEYPPLSAVPVSIPIVRLAASSLRTVQKDAYISMRIRNPAEYLNEQPRPNTTMKSTDFWRTTVLLIICHDRLEYLKRTLENVMKYYPR